MNVVINISLNPLPYPLDNISFTWSHDGTPLTNDIAILTYSSVTFHRILREESGDYDVTATNFAQGRQVGNDTGSFHLDVICKFLWSGMYKHKNQKHMS